MELIRFNRGNFNLDGSFGLLTAVTLLAFNDLIGDNQIERRSAIQYFKGDLYRLYTIAYDYDPLYNFTKHSKEPLEDWEIKRYVVKCDVCETIYIVKENQICYCPYDDSFLDGQYMYDAKFYI